MVPVNVSGMMTDNSPPSVKVIEFINRFNEKHGDKVQLVMATPHEVFQKVEQLGDIPVYRGDWTDWWADGIGSTPRPKVSYAAKAGPQRHNHIQRDKRRDCLQFDLLRGAYLGLFLLHFGTLEPICQLPGYAQKPVRLQCESAGFGRAR